MFHVIEQILHFPSKYSRHISHTKIKSQEAGHSPTMEKENDLFIYYVAIRQLA